MAVEDEDEEEVVVDRRGFFATGNVVGEVTIEDAAAAVASFAESVITPLLFKVLASADHVASSNKQKAARDPRNHRLPVIQHECGNCERKITNR